jgi:hypothetical protein
MLVSHAELKVLGAPVGPDRDGRRPAAHTISPGDPLLPILDQYERQPQAPANILEGVAVVAAVERHDGGRAFACFVESLKAAELSDARRRPGLPEVQQHVPTAEALKRKLFPVIRF